MISKKTKYGLQALLFLAREYGQGPLLISTLAERERIPKKFLEFILLQLKNAGVLQSQKGLYARLKSKRKALGKVSKIGSLTLSMSSLVAGSAHNKSPI